MYGDKQTKEGRMGKTHTSGPMKQVINKMTESGKKGEMKKELSSKKDSLVQKLRGKGIYHGMMERKRGIKPHDTNNSMRRHYEKKYK